MMKRLLISLVSCAACLAIPAIAAGQARLAYVTSHGATETVWLANADGTHAIKLGQGSTPVVSPDGQAVAAGSGKSHGASLVIYRPGASTLSLFDASQEAATPLAWSPDSRYLAVALSDGTDVASGRNSGLALVDTSTGTTTMVIHGDVCGASFDPSGSGKLVFGLSPAKAFCLRHTNLHTVNADGTGLAQLSHDGRSLNPVWGSSGIVFDRQTQRKDYAPVYQLWRLSGGQKQQLTRTHVPKLLDGFVPVAVSANGRHLLVDYVGEDTSIAYTALASNGRVRQIKLGHKSVVPAGLSTDGGTVLIDVGGFESAPSRGNIETVPFGGGRPHVLVRHAGEPSWNR